MVKSDVIEGDVLLSTLPTHTNLTPCRPILQGQPCQDAQTSNAIGILKISEILILRD